MGALRNILFGVITLAIAFSYQAYRDLTMPKPKPELGELESRRAQLFSFSTIPFDRNFFNMTKHSSTFFTLQI